MPDPISVISATALALHAAHITKDYIDGILNAPETVTAIVRDLAALETVLQQLDEQLKKDAFLKNPINVNIVPTVQQPLQNCTADSQQVKELLRKFVKPSGAANSGKWSGLMFTFREKELRGLQFRLRDSKDTLEAGLTFANYVVSLDSNAEIHDTHRGVQRLKQQFTRFQLRRGEDEYSMANTSYAASDDPEPESGVSVLPWLYETETVAGDGDNVPPAISVVDEDPNSSSSTTVKENPSDNPSEKNRDAQLKIAEAALLQSSPSAELSQDNDPVVVEEPVITRPHIISRPSSTTEEQEVKWPKMSDPGLLEGTVDDHLKTDELFSRYLSRTHALLSSRAIGKPRVRVAVLDTGLNTQHPEVQEMLEKAKEDGRVIKCKSWVLGLPNEGDLDGHGTHCAMVASYAAPNVDLYMARIFRDCSTISAQHVSEAIEYAVEQWKVDIISMSFGLPDADQAGRDSTYATIEKYRYKALFFAAASNNGRNVGRTFPARHPDVFCIHSATGDGTPSTFNPKPWLETRNNYSALGEYVKAPHCGRYTRRMTGTSVATPIAAGIAALVLEFVRQRPVEGQATIREVQRLKTKEGMGNVFAYMAHPKIDPRSGVEYRYLNLQPWNLLALHATVDGADFKHALNRISRIIDMAIADLYYPLPGPVVADDVADARA